MALLRGELRAADRADAYNPQRWRRLADLGITQGDVPLALTCAEQAGDLSLSLLLYSCVGDRAALAALAARAAAQEQLNIAFLALYLTGDVRGCIELLQAHGKLPEAAFFALAYQPSQIAQAFAVWQADLRAHHHVAAELIANPREYAEYFAGYEEALALEAQLAPLRAMDVKASEYPKYRRMVDGEGIDVSALESVRGDVKTEEVKGGKEEMKTEEVKEEEKEEDVKTEEVKEEVKEEMKKEDAKEDEIVKTENAETETDNVEEEFEAIIGSEEGTDDGDIDIDDLEKEWSSTIISLWRTC